MQNYENNTEGDLAKELYVIDSAIAHAHVRYGHLLEEALHPDGARSEAELKTERKREYQKIKNLENKKEELLNPQEKYRNRDSYQSDQKITE